MFFPAFARVGFSYTHICLSFVSHDKKIPAFFFIGPAMFDEAFCVCMSQVMFGLWMFLSRLESPRGLALLYIHFHFHFHFFFWFGLVRWYPLRRNFDVARRLLNSSGDRRQ